MIFSKFYGKIFNIKFKKMGAIINGEEKSASSKFTTEEEVYNELQRLIQVWRERHSYNSFSQRSHLSTIKREFRSERICNIILSNPDLFNIYKEFVYIPIDVMSDDLLIPNIYYYPKLLCSKDEKGERIVSIPEEKQTLPVLVAFELGKRRYETRSGMMWGRDYERIPYTGKAFELRNTLANLADNVTEQIGYNEWRNAIVSGKGEEDDVFVNKLISTIQDETSLTSIEPEKEYELKYAQFNYNQDKKLFILISGYADSGKTTFSQYLSSKITDSICFDSDQLLEHGLLDAPLSRLVRENDRVIVFSDTDAAKFFTPEEIGDANILKVYITPSSTKRMLQHSKYRKRK